MKRIDIPITLGFDKTKPCGRIKLTDGTLQILEKNKMDICLVPIWIKKPDNSFEIIEFTIIPFPEIKKNTDSSDKMVFLSSEMERDIKCLHGRIKVSPEGDRGTVIWNNYKSQGDKYCRDCKKAL